MPLPQLNVQDLTDQIVRKNFEKMVSFLKKESPLLGFRHYELTFDAAIANKKIPHSLGFLPKDVILTSLTGAGSVTFNYSNFDTVNFDITATNPCVVRFLAGTYQSGAL